MASPQLVEPMRERSEGAWRHLFSITPERPSYKWWVALTVMLCAFIVVMSSATVSVALPPIMTAFGLNIDQAQWIVTAYMIAGAVLIPTVGWLGNRLGNRNVFLISLLVFVAGSALCSFAWSSTSLILFRVLQGIGSGPIMPMALVILNSSFPPRQRGLAMGLYGLGVSFGPAFGPVLGGYVTEYLSWRMVFSVNVVPGILGMLLVMLVLPNTRESVKRSFDLIGLISLSVFLVCLLSALSQGHRFGWDAPMIQRLFVIGGLAFVVFVILELWKEEPLVEVSLYRDPAFAAVSLAGLGVAMAFWGTGFLQTILLQRLMGYTPAQGRPRATARRPEHGPQHAAGRAAGRQGRPALHHLDRPPGAVRPCLLQLFLSDPGSADRLGDVDDHGALRHHRLRVHADERRLPGATAAGKGAHGLGHPDAHPARRRRHPRRGADDHRSATPLGLSHRNPGPAAGVFVARLARRTHAGLGPDGPRGRGGRHGGHEGMGPVGPPSGAAGHGGGVSGLLPGAGHHLPGRHAVYVVPAAAPGEQWIVGSG